MDEIFDLIIDVVSDWVWKMQNFDIYAYGFHTNLWDVALGIEFTGLVASLAFAIGAPVPLLRSSSERAPKKEDE